MNKSTKGYLFEKDGSEKYILTHQTIIYPCKLRRVIGKRNVKGRKVDFEEIEIQDQSSTRYRCFIRRKDLTVSDILDLIVYYENGTRSIQSHPYTEDILDPSIIDELGIEVLTHKHYYFGDKKLRDLYCPVLKKNVTPELKEKLEQWSKEAIAQCERDEAGMIQRKSLPGLKWNKIERRTT